MGGLDVLVLYLVLVYLFVVLFAVFVAADYLGLMNKCCPQYALKEENKDIQGAKEKSDDHSETFSWV